MLMGSRKTILLLRRATPFFFGIVLCACATVQPIPIAMEPGASLKSYHAIAVAPVTVDSNVPVDSRLAGELQLDIEEALEQKSYQIADYDHAPAGALLVECEYVSFVPGSVTKNVAAVGATAVAEAAFWPLGVLVPASALFPEMSTAGDTEATVKASFGDKGSGQILGDLVVNGNNPPGVDAMQKYVACQIANAIDANIKGS